MWGQARWFVLGIFEPKPSTVLQSIFASPPQAWQLSLAAPPASPLLQQQQNFCYT
jgi:hypothetical protein